MKAITNLCRVLVGVLFIISGLIKANDALGFSYKLDEYFTVFNTPWFSHISLPLAMGISILEVALGFALLVGYRIVLVSWLLLLMIVSLPKDCHCFKCNASPKQPQSFTTSK